MQKSYLSFEQGDIVVADIIYSDQVGVKKRPAVVISNSIFNKKSEELILLKITSKMKETEYKINLLQKDLTKGELKIESQIIIDNPVTIYKERINKKIGKITSNKLEEIKNKIKKLYEIK